MGGLLWIAEALGAPTADVQRASDLASVEPDYRRRPALVRSVLPWETIHQLALANREAHVHGIQ